MKIGVWIFKKEKYFAGKFEFLNDIWETGCVCVVCQFVFLSFLPKECWFSNYFSGALVFLIFHCNQTCWQFYPCTIFLFILASIAWGSRAARIAVKNVNNSSVMNYFVLIMFYLRVSFKVIFLKQTSKGSYFFVGINEGKVFPSVLMKVFSSKTHIKIHCVSLLGHWWA